MSATKPAVKSIIVKSIKSLQVLGLTALLSLSAPIAQGQSEDSDDRIDCKLELDSDVVFCVVRTFTQMSCMTSDSGTNFSHCDFSIGFRVKADNNGYDGVNMVYQCDAQASYLDSTGFRQTFNQSRNGRQTIYENDQGEIEMKMRFVDPDQSFKSQLKLDSAACKILKLNP